MAAARRHVIHCRLSKDIFLSRLRHRGHVEECIQALRGYESVYDELELASEELRYAARALGKVTGAIDIEHILDAIFSEFCVGK
jgi:tRNA modification GTPase